MNHHKTETDPIAHDQDKFVHPDQTRTDEQIAYDEKYAVEPYGDDASDEYWADYDEYMGTVNGGEKPAEPALIIEPHKGYLDGSQVYVITSKRKYQEHSGNIQKMRDEGLTDEEIAEALDSEHDRIEEWSRNRKKFMIESGAYEDMPDEDPLAGDVDRWVDPDETKE